MPRTVGWPHAFHERAWTDIRDEHLAGSKDGTNDPVLAVTDSVIESGKVDVLAASTSMMDLMVVPRPIPDVPYDVLFVRALDGDRVVIEHVATTGRNDRIERPAREAIRSSGVS